MERTDIPTTAAACQDRKPRAICARQRAGGWTHRPGGRKGVHILVRIHVPADCNPEWYKMYLHFDSGVLVHR